MSRTRKIRESRQEIASIAEQLAALEAMTVGELRAKYREVMGEPSRSHNKVYLRKKIAWRIQELAEGGLSRSAKTQINALTAGLSMAWRRRLAPPASEPQNVNESSRGATQPASRDPRLPAPGSVLTRVHQGVEHSVTVLEDGFEYRNERFKSLSKVARAITGTPWNGFLFFGLQTRGRKRQ